MANAKNPVQVNVEMSVALKKQLDQACIDRDLTAKAAMTEALQAWLGQEPEDAPALRKLRRLMADPKTPNSKTIARVLSVILEEYPED